MTAVREKSIQSQIFAAVGSQPDIRIFRNNTGVAWMGESQRINQRTTAVLNPGDVIIRNARRVVFGLCEGSSDLIGLRRLTIGPEHLGRNIAQFVALEIKSSKGRATEGQINFLQMVQSMGGCGGVARSVDEAQALVSETLL